MHAGIAVALAVAGGGLFFTWLAGVISNHKLMSLWVFLGIIAGGCTQLCSSAVSEPEKETLTSSPFSKSK